LLWGRFLRTNVRLRLVRCRVEEPKSLGEHLLRRRLSLGLTQNQAAFQLSSNEWTYLLWEAGKTMPSIRFYPAIFEFLGYDPFPSPKTSGERILRQRRALGFSQKEAARRMKIDPGTFSLLESGKIAGQKYERQIAGFLSILLNRA
jgi:transcriptional regulator with XRE-family HTH domain